MLRSAATTAAAALGAAIALSATTARAVEIQDIARVKGLEENELIGMGLVVGLDGTGDQTKKSARLARPLLELYQRHGFGVEGLGEMSGIDSVAVVYVRCTIPATGTREGDKLEITVSAAGDAESLEGGELIWTALRARMGDGAFARASGRVEIQGLNKRRGVVRGGAQMLRDVRVDPVDARDGTIGLVLGSEYAGYPTAQAIASRISQEFAIDESTPGEVWATVADAQNIILHLAPWQQKEPAVVLRRVLTLGIDASLLETPARVVINKDAGTIVITGNVEISPAVVSARGLTITRITSDPAAGGGGALPAGTVVTENNVAIHAGSAERPGQTARLKDLLDALESLKVPFDERVAILRELHDTGVLHANLIDN